MPKRAPKGSQDIPSGQNFSPSEVELPEVLALVEDHSGDRKAFTEAIRRRFYDERPIPASGGTVWANVASGMVQYGIVTKDMTFTELGLALNAVRDDSSALYRILAEHLLLNCRGVTLIETLSDLHRAGATPSLPIIREALEERGIHTSSAGKSISLLRAWLGMAGLFKSQWVPNMPVYRDVLGQSEIEIESLSTLSAGQRATLRLLASLGPGEYDSSDLRKSVEKAYAVQLNEKQYPKDVLYPLRDLGFLEVTKKGGKGWTQSVVPTSQVESAVLEPLLDQLGNVPAPLRVLLRMSLKDIVAALDAGKHEKGLALEALGFKLMHLIGLTYRGTRYRPDQGGRFEVDLLFDSKRLAYMRWQIQCKNTDKVALDDVAKEVGLTYYLLTNVIVILTRGTVGEEARRYAIDVMQKTNLAIVLIERPAVDRIVDDPLAIFEVLEEEAEFALEQKPLVAAAALTSPVAGTVDVPS